jgi:cbb3-type cytochrome oxidase subunit 3
VTVYDSADLCSLSSLTKKSRSQCPYNGYYQVKTHFYWGSDGESETFVPTITVGFKSSAKKNVYDFGGANTDLCSGSSFSSWSEGVRVKYANAMGSFFKTFGLLLVTIVFVGGFAFFLSKRPRNLDEAKAHVIESKRNFMSRVTQKFRRPREPIRDLSIHEGEEFDFQKIKTAGNRDLLDF